MGKKRKGKKKPKVTLAQAQAARAFEGALNTPQRRNPVGANLSQDAAVDHAMPTLREWGRYLDENSPLVVGILDSAVAGIVGRGIVTIPKPVRTDGSIDEEFGRDIIERQRRWAKRCDVTGELSWGEAQRYMCRAWLRDGESFHQHVMGRDQPYPFTGDETPYRIELLESDMVPWELTSEDEGWRQGIRLNDWRMPTEYAVYRRHPGDYGVRFTSSAMFPDPQLMKRVPASIMTHLKLSKRWPATRGASLLHPIVSTLYDVKDLEESERIKNRILASWTAAIQKSPDIPGYEATDESGQRFLSMAGGTVIDTLAPGETITGVGPEYPNAEINEYLDGQIRRVAAGAGVKYSSIARRYDSSYSAMRQELVESQALYQIREDAFCSKVVQGCYERMLLSDLAAGHLILPADMELEGAMMTEHRGPATPWIDPLKEVQADALAVEKGFATQESIQIKRGAPPELIMAPPPRQPAQLSLIDTGDEEEAA